MNKTCTLFAATGMALGSICSLNAQTAPSVISKLPDEIRWKVESVPLGIPDEKSTMLYVQEKQVDRTATMRRDISIWSDDSKVEQWFIPYHKSTMLLRDQRGDSRIYMMELDGELGIDPRADWPELSWVIPDHFVDEQKVEGKLARYYEAPAGPETEVLNKLWISTGTGLPMFFEDGKFRHKYTVLGAPQPLVLPGRFETALSEHRAKLAKERQRSLLLP